MRYFHNLSRLNSGGGVSRSHTVVAARFDCCDSRPLAHFVARQARGFACTGIDRSVKYPMPVLCSATAATRSPGRSNIRIRIRINSESMLDQFLYGCQHEIYALLTRMSHGGPAGYGANYLCGDEKWAALLSKSSEGRADAVCNQFYNTGTVTGVPSRVKRLSTAARICNSAT